MLKPPSYNVDKKELTRLVDEVLAHSDPGSQLHHHLLPLVAAQNLEMQAALYESVVARTPIHHYWALFTMSRCYSQLGRMDASFLLAVMALDKERKATHAYALFRDVFGYLADRGCFHAALEIFREQLGYFPESPIATHWELLGVANAAGVVMDQQLTTPGPFMPSPTCLPTRVLKPEIRCCWLDRLP